MKTYKVFAALLSYPTDDLCRAVQCGELERTLVLDGLVGDRELRALLPLLDELSSGDLLDLQARYVDLFDRSRSRSLYLFEHVHGESRDRGQAMVELKTMYARAGLEIDGNELPDFLPLYLEYLSALDPEEARRRLGQPMHVICAVGERLHRRDESYAGVFAVLEALCPETLDGSERDQLLAEGDDDPNDTARLDAEWEDEPVTFGPGTPGMGDGACGRAAEIVARIAAGTDTTV